MEEKPVTLPVLSQRLHLPWIWLKGEALAGRIPCLKIGRELRFNVEAVQRCLNERAANARCEGEAVHA